MAASGILTFATSAVADTSGTATLKVQLGSNAPPGSWAKLNVIVDATGSPSCQLVADTVTLDQAGGPQPQLGPAVFAAGQNVTVVVTGAQPSTTIVAHCSGVWAASLADLQAVSTPSGGTIGAQQIVGTPFLENAALTVGSGGTVTTATYPMLGYTGVLVQFIAAGVSTMPTVTLQWLDTSVPPVQLYQSNWQAQKVIDWVQAWGQQMRVAVQNNDSSTLSLSLMLVPLSAPPGRKADILTYKATALNELVSIRGTPCTSGATIQATTPAGLGYSGPATVYLDTGWTRASGDTPDYAAEIAYGPTGTGKILWEAPQLCPNILGMPVDLPDQPLTLFFTNNAVATVVPSFAVEAAYR